jgi:hypothetical protein
MVILCVHDYYKHRKSPSAKWKENTRPNIDWQGFRDYLRDYLDENYYYEMKNFASEIGVDPSVLSRYLSGKQIPAYKPFTRIAEQLGITYERFEKMFMIKLLKKTYSDWEKNNLILDFHFNIISSHIFLVIILPFQGSIVPHNISQVLDYE